AEGTPRMDRERPQPLARGRARPTRRADRWLRTRAAVERTRVIAVLAPTAVSGTRAREPVNVPQTAEARQKARRQRRGGRQRQPESRRGVANHRGGGTARTPSVEPRQPGLNRCSACDSVSVSAQGWSERFARVCPFSVPKVSGSDGG